MANVGGVKDVPANQNSIEIDDLARFAVDEHNKKTNAILEFSKVVKVKEQVVSGTIYHLTIEVSEGGQKKVYEAKIWIKLWENFKQVQEFKLLGDGAVGSSA